MSKTVTVSQVDGRMIPYGNALEIRRVFPSLEQQYEYRRRVGALRDYYQTPEMVVAEIEAEAAMSETIDEMRERGDLATATDGKDRGDRLSSLLGMDKDAANQAYHRWSQVAAIPLADRLAWYQTVEKPSRSALLAWQERREQRFERSKVHKRKTDFVGNDLPERLIPAFAFSGFVDDEIAAFAERLSELGSSRGGELLSRCRGVFDRLVERMHEVLPHAVCVSCGGEQCDLCDGRGWMTAEEYLSEKS